MIWTSAQNPLQLRVHTVSVWLMASMPITQALFLFWVFSVLPAESSSWTRVLAVVFTVVLMGALASQDSRLMHRAGHARTAPWITAVLAPPLYLGIRGARVNRVTGALPWPLMVWLAAQLSVIALWFLLGADTVQSLVGALL